MQYLWDNFWRGRGRKNTRSWAKKRIEGVLSNYIAPGLSVLDLGCGSGFFSSYFISCGCRVYSMDYSLEAVEAAKRITEGRSSGYLKLDILEKDASSNFDRKFDIIFTDGLLEHYSREEQNDIMRKMKEIKTKDGYVINFVPNRFSLWSLVRPFFINIRERPFVMREFLDLHTGNNLEIISYGGISVLPFRVSPERLLGRYLGMLYYCVVR